MQWLRRRRLLPAISGALIIIYGIVGFWAVPYFARNAIVAYVEKDLHRHVSIGTLKFNPFTLTARVNAFALAEADHSPLASFSALTVNAELSSLIHGAYTFKELRLDQPNLHLIVNADGSLNLAQLQPPSARDPVAQKSQVPHIRIGSLQISRGQVHLEDRSRPKPFARTLQPIEFTLTDFRTELKFENAYRFVAATDSNERLEWAGEFSVQPFGSTGKFTVSALKATTIAGYLQDKLPFDLQSGLLDMQGRYELAFREQLSLKIQLPVVRAREVAIAPASAGAIDGATPDGAIQVPWITVPELTIAETSLSFAERALTIGKVHMGDAHIQVWREADGTLNLTRLAPKKPEAPAPATNKPTAATPPWIFGVDSVAIERANIYVEDRSVTPTAKLVLAPFNVMLNGYSSKPNSQFNLGADITVNEHAHLSVKGPVGVEPTMAELKISLRDFDLAPLQGYVATNTDMTVVAGHVSAQTNLRYAMEPARGQPQLKFSGDVEIDDLLTKDTTLQEDFIKWQSLKITGIDFQQNGKQPALDHLNIARIQAKQPYGRVIVGSDSTLNVAHVLTPQKRTAAISPDPATVESSRVKPAAAKATRPLPIRIRSVVVENGATSFADYSVKPAFAAEIGELQGFIDGLSSAPDSRAQVQLSGNVDRYAPVSITGDANPLAGDAYSDIALRFHNIELTLFNPYSGKFAGYNITKGKLSTEMHYKIENRKLDATHHIVLDQLEFGAATDSKEALSLPLKLAVALLKDRHGVIDLDLPVNGSLDDPGFRVGPIVWQVLKNTLEKIVAAPFKLLGSLFGGGEELAFVDFAPGSAAPTRQESDKLGKLKLAMAERPQLKLDIPLHVIAATDTGAVAHATLEQAMVPLINAKTDRLAALATVYAKEFGKPPAYPDATDKKVGAAISRTRYLAEALLEKFVPTSAQLDELARQRGAAVRDLLLSGGEIAPDRVFLSNRASAATRKNDLVRMELKLE